MKPGEGPRLIWTPYDLGDAPACVWWAPHPGRPDLDAARIEVYKTGSGLFVAGACRDEEHLTLEAAQLGAEAHLRRGLVISEARAAAGLAALNGYGPWQLGARVTVCSSEGPLFVAEIGRMSRLGFRLKASALWFGFDGQPLSEKQDRLLCARCGIPYVPTVIGWTVRPFADSDEDEIRRVKESTDEKRKRSAALQQLKSRLMATEAEMRRVFVDYRAEAARVVEAERVVSASTAKRDNLDRVIVRCRADIETFAAQIKTMEAAQ